MAIAGCGGSGDGSDDNSPPVTPPVQTPVSVLGVSADLGNFDPAPTVDGAGKVWMSYSHVSQATSGIASIETRLATTVDAGLNWQDEGVINAVTSLPLPAPFEINAVAHEVSRLLYNPYAAAVGADPWIILWHRYLSVLNGEDTARLFQHGWIGMKSGSSAVSLGGERKLFSGALYDVSNNSDSLGVPEYPLDQLYPASLSQCDALSEPGILAKSSGIYISLYCASVAAEGKIILLRCSHDMTGCEYLGDLITGSEAGTVSAAYDGFSASELVSVDGQDYLMVTPTISTGDVYRGCVAYRITDLDNAGIERNAGTPVAALVVEQNGDFNGACGYVKELSGSGILISQAFIDEIPIFRLFATGKYL